MSQLSSITEHQIRPITVDDEKYYVSLRVGYDGIEYVGRLVFTQASTEISYQDHGGVPGETVADAVHRAKDFSDGQLRQRCHRALSEKRRFGKLRRATDELIEKIKYLNRVAIGLDKGLLDSEGGKTELDQTQAELVQIVSNLRRYAGVEDEKI